MTLRLVSDNSDPEGPDYANVPQMLRQYANEIEAGQYGDVEMAMIAVLAGDDVFTLGCGEEPTPLEMIGMFEAAKLKTLADMYSGDE